MKQNIRIGYAGFTLVEVLISVVVLSIGLLGLMGLQTVALRQNNSSQTRTYAVDFMNELAGRMRANRAGVDTNRYNPDQIPAPLNSPPAIPTDPQFDCITSFPAGGAICSPQQMAQVDLFAWKTSASVVFPGSQATVTCTDNLDPGFSDANGDNINDADTDGDPCTDGSLHLISLSWVDGRGTNQAPAVFRMTFAP